MVPAWLQYHIVLHLRFKKFVFGILALADLAVIWWLLLVTGMGEPLPTNLANYGIAILVAMVTPIIGLWLRDRRPVLGLLFVMVPVFEFILITSLAMQGIELFWGT